MEVLVGFLLALLSGYLFGWSRAHTVVATECERLGGFYVGDKVFKCYQVDDRRYTPHSHKPLKSQGSNPPPPSGRRPKPPSPPSARNQRWL